MSVRVVVVGLDLPARTTSRRRWTVGVAHPYHSAVRFVRKNCDVSGYPVRIGPVTEESRVSIEEQHVAMPKLYGAPAYARPAAPVATGVIRPFDPDQLPLEAQQTEDEREFTSMLPARAYAPGGVDLGWIGRRENGGGSGLRPRSLSLRSIAGKLLGGN